eukprot:6190950-Lingulodinium_polyedra.AAC.1
MGRARNTTARIARWGGPVTRNAEEPAWQLAVKLENAGAAGLTIARTALGGRGTFARIPHTRGPSAQIRAGAP